jgi:hypothetical protein
MLYRYPGVALALQFWGIRGKKGRLRRRLGTVERTEAGDTRFGVHPPQVKRTSTVGVPCTWTCRPIPISTCWSFAALYTELLSVRWPCFKARSTRLIRSSRLKRRWHLCHEYRRAGARACWSRGKQSWLGTGQVRGRASLHRSWSGRTCGVDTWLAAIGKWLTRENSRP